MVDAFLERRNKSKIHHPKGRPLCSFCCYVLLLCFFLYLWKSCQTNIKAESVETASLIRLIPIANNGSPEICPIQKNDTKNHHQEISFVFQKRRFIYDEKEGTFSPPRFSIDQDTELSHYQKATGLKNEDIDQLTRNYGPNKFDIPVPTFTELFKEHAVAPFFVFQMFCVGLWFMDELWYYSLFSLFMLVAFESTVVFQRQKTMQEFRGMGIVPYAINVYDKH